MKRVLHIVSALERGGAEMMIMNIYRRINHRELQFDFVSHGLQEGEFEAEIRNLGGRIYRINSLGRAGPVAYIKNLISIIRGGRYEAIHVHTDFQGGVVAFAAFLAGVKIRICHSHCTSWNRGKHGIQAVGLQALKGMTQLFANQYCACSQEAGRFLFGSNYQKMNILNNTIDVASYQSLKEVDRQLGRAKLGIPEENIVIGHVGRFSESKNQAFILKLLHHLHQNGVKVSAIFIGEGPLKQKTEAEAERLGLAELVHFPGIQEDVPKWMYLFDVFVFPSLFEGFGIAVLEAQCAGTPCIVSDGVPAAVDVGLGLVTNLSLDGPIHKWTEAISGAAAQQRLSLPVIHEYYLQNSFDIEHSVRQWEELYMSAG